MRTLLRIVGMLAAAWLGLTHLDQVARSEDNPPSNEPPLSGFSAANARREYALERQFDALLDRGRMRDWMKQMTAHPHHLGSAYDRANAEFIAAQFRAWGYETAIEQFDVLFPTPKARLLELVAPTRFQARLEEPPLPEDKTSSLTREQLPTYNAYSIDGDVTGELVYVNYGVPKDYETLAERGIEVRGRIVLARYGGSWRGIKPKVAAEHGAIGCILYSDPRGDGYFEGDVYPQGAWRGEFGAQRGSVLDLPLYPGDPLTPDAPAAKNAPRLPRDQAPTITKIPVLPIGYGDALPLLHALTNGPAAPEDWRGALPLTYHVGPGPARVHLKLAFNWDLTPLYDVIARLDGSERPDQWIIRGNHHDAWVCGATDPVSGTVALMEEAQALSALVKQGWRPKRTILFGVWDGEEPGLLGSTEWVEAHADSLKEKGAVYINGDTNSRSFLRVGGSHTLEHFVNEIARDVLDPELHVTVAERFRANAILHGDQEMRRDFRERADFRIDALGSGSDYTPFLQHLGVASLDIRYASDEAQGGVYHSIYDSYDHFTRFVDPTFDYEIALAQTSGRAVLRLANADVLPFSFLNLTDTLARYAKEVAKLADDLREATIERNRELAEGTFRAGMDAKQAFVAPARQEPVPFLNLTPLANALVRLQTSARAFQTASGHQVGGIEQLTQQAQQQLDAILLRVERAMTSPQGLPRRPWYRHLIYAPGFYTGYGVKTLPGVREAIEQRKWSEAEEQAVVTARAIEGVAAEIDRATALLKPSGGEPGR